MALYYIFTVDGDWNEYFHEDRPDVARQPDERGFLGLLEREMAVSSVIGNTVLHFIHTSAVAPDLFLKAPYADVWKKIEARGGSVGVHCHHEGLYRDGRLTDEAAMNRSIGLMAGGLRSLGLHPISYRGGYLTFCERNIPLLEKHGLFLDFSCDPGRYLRHGGEIVSDWREAPRNFYRMSYEDHRKPGGSKVIEIPLGKTVRGALYIDTMPLTAISRAARTLAQQDGERGGDTIVSVLTHTYEFASLWKCARIALALTLCKGFGAFITDREAAEIIAKKGE